uniref:Uncharacterized protein n=1 Tax=Anguilla anguilla TaxID=7936 RepID=A0A0E9VTF3_ANGAN
MLHSYRKIWPMSKLMHSQNPRSDRMLLFVSKQSLRPRFLASMH